MGKKYKIFFSAGCSVFMLVFLILPGFSQESWLNSLKEADRYRLFSEKGFSFEYRLTDKGETSTMMVYLKNTDRSVVLCVYTAPPELVGRKIFMDGNSFWLLDKRMQDPIRISARQMLFGQASAGDITRILFSDSYKVLEGKKDGPVIILELAAQPGKEISYPRVRLELNDADSRPVKAELYAATGTLMRTIYYEKYKTINNKILLTQFRVVNELNKEESIIELDKFEEKTLENRYFSREGMKALK
ncbi:outer membrane lipoprotein-sorting protein [Treponema sp. J25]|uniref:outer membrane lipoprotein-sorting protein n=1 Tax=Treponema sp. J25 TaxID=2094121 RepID=UPI00104B2A6F|nr:outer membrane lipoprotein-sorting protein [Treponema sp. J25]MCX7656075.1 outer membrane lipoprotein-sorting protein [Treponemataceae bacterium]TCW60251.1 hypothetical protein C5O22_12450 [Treponema sp. J25]